MKYSIAFYAFLPALLAGQSAWASSASSASILYTLGSPAGFQGIDLNPEAGAADFGQTNAAGALVGVGSSLTKAVMWNSQSPGGIDLTPTGASSAYALGTDGTYEVGTVNNEAAVWGNSNRGHNSFFGLNLGRARGRRV